jgi:hypothetical protein
MTAAELAGASEVLVRLAARMEIPPDNDGYVRVKHDHRFFGALQQLLRDTQWNGRFCWELGGDLVVDMRPREVEVRCPTCNGKGTVTRWQPPSAPRSEGR